MLCKANGDIFAYEQIEIKVINTFEDELFLK
jgi:hypothetical protein